MPTTSDPLGEPRRQRGLAVLAVYQDAQTSPVACTILGEAVARGEVVVAEQLHASVPTLQVQNRGEVPASYQDRPYAPERRVRP